MKTMFGVFCVAGLWAAFVLAPASSAVPGATTETICGEFIGLGPSRVCLTTVTQGEELKRVEDFRFRGLPADCGPRPTPKPTLSGKDAKIDGDGKRFRSRHPNILGGYTGVDAKVVGKVTDEGQKATGEVRVRARDSAGEACDTRARKWKAKPL